MDKSLSEKITQVGNSVSSAAKSVGTTISKGTEAAVEYVIEKVGIETDEGKDFGIAGVKEHMEVIASCGKKIGVVDGIEANAVKLTRKDRDDDQHHFIPLSWVARVDSQVHLNKNSKEAVAGWKSNAMSCGCDDKCDSK
jgi:hypothetical protein